MFKTEAKSPLIGHRHGLTRSAIIMTEEDLEAFHSFAKRFIADLKPVGAVETSFAELIAGDHYRLRRAQAIEENTFALGHSNKAAAFEAEHPQVHDAATQARVFDFSGRLFQNLALYESRINRRMLNNLKAFHALQDRRKAQEREDALAAKKPKTFAANAGTASEPRPSGSGTEAFGPPEDTKLAA